MRAGSDHRTDELECKPDRTCFEWGQPGRAAERVAEELLVDMDLVTLELGVDGVAPAAEVDEVEERKMLFELLGRNREAIDEVLRGDHALALLAAGGEEVGEE